MMFTPFKMPDFVSRPEGQSKTLKDMYIYLRRSGFPEKDLFIRPAGEFSRYKGEILEQHPAAGETVSPGKRIVIMAAVPGISQVMPDLFTDYFGDYTVEDDNPRRGAHDLFAVFDSAFIKMKCRLEWIRDIYAGVYQSGKFLEYLNSIFFMSDMTVNRLGDRSLDFIPSKLSRYIGTESALYVYFESLTGLKINSGISRNHEMPVPGDSVSGLGQESLLGENTFIGQNFEIDKPELSVNLRLQNLEDIPTAVRVAGDGKDLADTMRPVLPYYIESFNVSVEPENEGIEYVQGKSFLGFNTVLGGMIHEIG